MSLWPTCVERQKEEYIYKWYANTFTLNCSDNSDVVSHLITDYFYYETIMIFVSVNPV